MKFTKEHEGKDIYALPTSNNARHSKKIVKFKVIKVKRKYVELAMYYDDLETLSKHTDNYCPSTGATQTQINRGYGLNAGYKFFNNEKEINEYNLISSIKINIRDFFPYWLGDMSNEDILLINDIIKKYNS